MSTVRAWKPGFHYYKELVGIECESFDEDVYQIMSKLFDDNLRACLRELIGNTVVVPKAAVRFLPIRDVRCCIVALRDAMFVPCEVLEKLQQRFQDRKRGATKPHYYIAKVRSGRKEDELDATLAPLLKLGKSRRNAPIICRSLVAESTIKEIERELKN
ncbi:MAG: hypothetical protein G01um101429_832 [Parcubacteria group bacterium Gr01-1014_29]|nr:MAG: hypothetical protein G01um101429_832 [Parcubacteria group bacterium Gr01-1014_29]